MLQERKACEAVYENSVAVLMARIVDRAGVCLRPAHVASVRYSILEKHPRTRSPAAAVPGHDGVPLDVAEVLLEELAAGPPWDVDLVGYNFRHVLRTVPSDGFPRLGASYEIRYVLTPVEGPAAVLRFPIRIFS